MLRHRPMGGKKSRVVRFAVHDLSCVAPPKVTQPGSEAEQERFIGELVQLMQAQHKVLPPSFLASSASKSTGGAVVETRECLVHLLASLEALAGASVSSAGLSSDMRASARFYGGELERWVLMPEEPMLHRRLAELLSSSLRLHLSAVFSEEEESQAPDPLLASIHERVREHAATYAFSVPMGEDAAEHFAALVTYHLGQLKQYEHLTAAGSAARGALAGAGADESGEERGAAAAAALQEFPADEREALLKWAQAHSVLLQVFGASEPLTQLKAAPLNVSHFGALSSLAGHVHDLGLKDEDYLAPLRDLDRLQETLEADVQLAKGLHEGLQLLATSRGGAAGRRSSRRRN